MKDRKATMTPAARRYALALANAAAEANESAAVAKALAALAPALQGQTLAALASPTLGADDRQKLAQKLASTLKAPATLAGLLNLLAVNRRLALLPEVIEAYRHHADKAANRVTVRLESAQPLTPAQRESLEKQLAQATGATEVAVEEVSRPDLRAGFRAFYNGLVWDASLAGRFGRLQQQLKNALNRAQH